MVFYLKDVVSEVFWIGNDINKVGGGVAILILHSDGWRNIKMF
jgi:hypothetical protein